MLSTSEDLDVEARNLAKLTACFAALDRAVAVVAQEEFDSLRRGLRAAEVTAKIANALRGLGTLQNPSAAPPDYKDPWLALCYILWYQPGQTYLAYRLLSQLAQGRRFGILQVVDFGCGSLATEIALDIALMTGTITAGRPTLSSAYVDSLDLSPEMIRFGESISREMLTYPDSPFADSDLISERNLVDPDTLDFSNLVPGEDRWLTAFHTVYGPDTSEINHRLTTISDRVRPDVLLMTSHRSKMPALRQASPVAGAQSYQIMPPSENEQQALPDMTDISRVRQRIQSFATETKLPSESNADVNLVVNYMGGIPDWMQSVQSTRCIAYEWSRGR